MMQQIKEVAEKAIALQNKLGMETALNEIVEMCARHSENYSVACISDTEAKKTKAAKKAVKK